MNNFNDAYTKLFEELKNNNHVLRNGMKTKNLKAFEEKGEEPEEEEQEA